MSVLIPQKKQATIFRPAALAHHAAGDALDTLLHLPRPRGWLPLLCLAGLILACTIWGVVGRIPVAAPGRGVLVRPGRVVPFQATSQGQILALYVREGDRVEKGTLLGTVDQAGLRKDLDLERTKLERLQTEYAGIEHLHRQRTELEKAIIALRREDLTQRIQDLQALAEQLRKSGTQSITRQRESTTKALELAHKVTTIQSERVEQVRKAGSAGVSEEMMQANQQYLQAVSREVELQGQIQQLDLRADQVQDTYLEKQDKIAGLKAQLNELAIQEKKLEQETLELITSHKLALQDVQRSISRLELEVDRQGKIVSEHAGRIVEMTAAVGQVVSPGTKLGVVAEEDESAPLVCVAYCSITAGKRIQPGMRVRVAPDPVQRERYGSLTGTVKEVTPFPVSKEAAAHTVGNTELAGALTDEGRQIEVVIELDRDPATPSGFAWTSLAGPPSALSAGTSGDVQVIVETRSPASFVFPFLRSWSGS